MDHANILDSSRLCYEGDFDTQVENFMNDVRLTAGEVHNLRYLFIDLEMALQDIAPGLQILPFGSIVTGLGIKTSDVDCFIALPHGMKPPPRCVIQARNILRRHYKKFTKLFAIVNAKVPIVKFLHIPTGCNCDINFKSSAGVHNSQLIGTLLRMDHNDRALKLAIIVKYWSKVHKMTGTNLMSSYALTLMVIFYLQLMNILPSVYDMQKNIPNYMVDNWNMAFDKNMCSNPNNSDSLYDLLGGFYKCYANVDLEENIISPFMGRLINKKLFKNINEVPDEFELYKKNLLRKVAMPLKLDSMVCVQDPFEHARNSTGAIYPRLACKIKAHFQFASKKFEELPAEYFLQTILSEDTVEPLAPPTKNHQMQKAVVKNNVATPPRKRGLQNAKNLIRCFEQIRGVKRQKTK